MTEHNDYDLIPARMSVVLLCVLMLMLLCFFAVRDFDGTIYPYLLLVPVLVAVYIWWIWDALRSFRLDSSGITIFRFGKAIRRIPWTQVEQIGVTRRGDSYKGGHATFLLIVMKGCEHYDPFMDVGHEFCSRNSSMILTFDNVNKYQSLFEKYYGPVDFDIRRYKPQYR